MHHAKQNSVASGSAKKAADDYSVQTAGFREGCTLLAGLRKTSVQQPTTLQVNPTWSFWPTRKQLTTAGRNARLIL